MNYEINLIRGEILPWVLVLIYWLLVSVLTSIANKIAPCVVALISHGIVAAWIVSCLVLIACGLDLERYVLRNCYGVGVYYNLNNSYIFKAWCCRSLIFQTMKSAKSNSQSLKYKGLKRYKEYMIKVWGE